MTEFIFIINNKKIKIDFSHFFCVIFFTFKLKNKIELTQFEILDLSYSVSFLSCPVCKSQYLLFYKFRDFIFFCFSENCFFTFKLKEKEYSSEFQYIPKNFIKKLK